MVVTYSDNLVQSAVVFSQVSSEDIRNFTPINFTLFKPGMVGAVDLELLQPNVFDPNIFQYDRANLGNHNMDKTIHFKDKMSVFGDLLKFCLINENPNKFDIKTIKDTSCKIVDFLEKVPTSAVGINFTYRFDKTEYTKTFNKFFNNFSKLKDEINSFSSTMKIDRKNNVKLTIATNNDKIELISGGKLEGFIIGFNYNKDFNDRATTKQRKEYIKSIEELSNDSSRLLEIILED